jgi:L-alanine-DL-glutamate epimerase-like enolase superfamily enzyme
MVLMSDPVAAYSYTQALWVGRELEKLGFHWLEEPLSDFDVYGYAKLARDLDIPIAAAESTPGSVTSAAQYITAGALDIMRSDVSWKAGITGLLKTAHLCEAFGIACEIHTTTLALMEVANLHVACAIANCEYAEVLVPAETFAFGVKQPLTVDANGDMVLPPGAGLGVELDWDAIDNATVERR